VRTLATQMQSRCLKDVYKQEQEQGRGEQKESQDEIQQQLAELCQASATQANEHT